MGELYQVSKAPKIETPKALRGGYKVTIRCLLPSQLGLGKCGKLP